MLIVRDQNTLARHEGSDDEYDGRIYQAEAHLNDSGDTVIVTLNPDGGGRVTYRPRYGTLFGPDRPAPGQPKEARP